MGNARAIGFALAALLASSGPALAPLRVASEAALDPAPARCGPLAPLEIALECPPPALDWLAASVLRFDPLATPRPDAAGGPPPSFLAEPLATDSDLARVPEPRTLLGVALGLAGLATARRATATHSG